MNNDRPPTLKLRKWLMRNKESTLPGLINFAQSQTNLAMKGLNVKRMIVGPGGKQPIMKDTVFNGLAQKLVNDSGTPKGMKLILQEREVDTLGMNAQRKVLGSYEDFYNIKTLV